MLSECEPWRQRVSQDVFLSGVEDPDGSKPALHFLHGNGFCGGVYETFLNLLASEYSLFLSDARGHGDSDAGSEFPGWNAMAEECLSVATERFSQRGARRLIGMGHSLGGVLSILMAARNPGLFDRLVLLDPVLFSPAMLLGTGVAHGLGFKHINPMARRARERTSRWDSREEVRESLRGRGIFRGWPEEALVSYSKHALRVVEEGAEKSGVTLKCPTWFEGDVFDSTPRGLWRAIGQIQCPTLILVGCDTYPFIGESAKRAARRNPNIEWASLPGGHCFMMEHPKETQAALRDFLHAP